MRISHKNIAAEVSVNLTQKAVVFSAEAEGDRFHFTMSAEAAAHYAQLLLRAARQLGYEDSKGTLAADRVPVPAAER